MFFKIIIYVAVCIHDTKCLFQIPVINLYLISDGGRPLSTTPQSQAVNLLKFIFLQVYFYCYGNCLICCSFTMALSVPTIRPYSCLFAFYLTPLSFSIWDRNNPSFICIMHLIKLIKNTLLDVFIFSAYETFIYTKKLIYKNPLTH